jgi:hypothetical protein
VAGALDPIRLVVSASPTANQPVGQFLFNTASGSLFWDADGNGAGLAVHIANLNAALGVPITTLAASDFIIVA